MITAGVMLSNLIVQGSINISGVTVVGASAQEVAAEIIKQTGDDLASQKQRIDNFRSIYGLIALYVDEFRKRTSTLSNDASAPAIISLVQKHLEVMRSAPAPNWLDFTEYLTTLAMLERVYGQYLQIAAGKMDPNVTPASIHLKRQDLTAKKTDLGYFVRSESHIREALKICEERFGSGNLQTVVLLNELGLLHRDRGEYKRAAAQFKLAMAELNQYHPNEKQQIAGCYFNWATVLRERRSHLGSLWFFWAASVFEESSDSMSILTLEARRQQVYYFSIYLIFQIISAILFFAPALYFSRSFGVLILCALFSALFYKFFMFVADRFIVIVIAAKVIGVETGLRWPQKAQPIELESLKSQILLESSDRVPNG
jgi:tetratricopeptide (TPR) repeat protein